MHFHAERPEVEAAAATAHSLGVLAGEAPAAGGASGAGAAARAGAAAGVGGAAVGVNAAIVMTGSLGDYEVALPDGVTLPPMPFIR